MERIFLSRLYYHSRPAFFICLIYLAVYAFLFTKKMDMVIFPYNNMFSLNAGNDLRADSYHLKFGTDLVQYTHFFWWKKDLMESSARKYATTISGEQYVARYVDHSFGNESIRSFLKSKLVPSKEGRMEWLNWYVSKGGAAPTPPVSIWKYNIQFGKNISIDSTLIYISRP